MNTFEVIVGRTTRKGGVDPILREVIQTISTNMAVYNHFSGLYRQFSVTVKDVEVMSFEEPAKETAPAPALVTQDLQPQSSMVFRKTFTSIESERRAELYYAANRAQQAIDDFDSQKIREMLHDLPFVSRVSNLKFTREYGIYHLTGTLEFEKPIFTKWVNEKVEGSAA